MRVIVTAGPTREYIDNVRFISNPSSGKMGYACGAAAIAAGHEVTLLTGPVCLAPPAGCEVAGFESVGELQAALEERFDACDAVIMTAAVGDFSVQRQPGKLSRAAGPVEITLAPTPDVIASVASGRRADQTLIAFAVETDRDQAKARSELAAKNCDYVVLNTPAAMAADESEACILSAAETILPWARRPKTALAAEIVKLLNR